VRLPWVVVGGIGQRELAWDGCHNVRDLGGLPLAAGGETRYRAVVRADSLAQLTSAGWSDALSYGVQRVVDLRFAEERSRDDGNAVPVDVVHVSLFGERDPIKDQEWDASTRSMDDLTEVFAALYVETIDACSAQVVVAVNAIAESNGGCVAVHCFAGKDRTGIVAALLLSVAGVHDAVIVRDFAASDAGVLRLCADWVASAEGDAERAYRTRVLTAPAAAMASMLEHVTAKWGGAASYLLAHEVGEDAVRHLRSRLAGA
jgi:protein-tyrosine phosphatase